MPPEVATMPEPGGPPMAAPARPPRRPSPPKQGPAANGGGNADKSLGGWVKAHKTEAAVGAVVAAVGAALYLRSRSSSSSTTGTTSASPAEVVDPASDTGSYSGNPGSGFTNYGAAPTWSQGGTAGAGSPTTPGQASGQTATANGVTTEPLSQQVGAGAGFSAGANYAEGAVTAPSGDTYATIPSAAATLAMLQNGQPVYYEPSLGNFQQITSAAQFNQVEASASQPTTTWSQVPSGSG